MANGNPARVDVYKRSLYKWIRVDGKATKPSEASRYLIAVALDVDLSEVPADDDEEDHAMANDLFRAVAHMVDQAVRERVNERMRESVT